MTESNLTPIEQHVVDYIYKLRVDRDLTQEDIATIINVSQSFIATIENPSSRAKYNLNHINAIADHFGLSPQDFLPKKPL